MSVWTVDGLEFERFDAASAPPTTLVGWTWGLQDFCGDNKRATFRLEHGSHSALVAVFEDAQGVLPAGRWSFDASTVAEIQHDVGRAWLQGQGWRFSGRPLGLFDEDGWRRQRGVHRSVWVFQGVGGRFASGVFETRAQAEAWIHRHGLEGLLTRYPVGISALDWAIEHAGFEPKADKLQNPRFIQTFTGGHEHYHYDNDGG